jgi:hypothetical protein
MSVRMEQLGSHWTYFHEIRPCIFFYEFKFQGAKPFGLKSYYAKLFLIKGGGGSIKIAGI